MLEMYTDSEISWTNSSRNPSISLLNTNNLPGHVAQPHAPVEKIPKQCHSMFFLYISLRTCCCYNWRQDERVAIPVNWYNSTVLPNLDCKLWCTKQQPKLEWGTPLPASTKFSPLACILAWGLRRCKDIGVHNWCSDMHHCAFLQNLQHGILVHVKDCLIARINSVIQPARKLACLPRIDSSTC